MTVQLSSLRVSADMDASKYVAGMQQKIAADKAGAASSREVGNAVSETDRKLSTAANGLERLMRQTVDGYSASQGFERSLRTLQRAFDTGNVSAERAEQILVGLHGRYGLAANASDLAARGQVDLAAAVTRANATLAAQENQMRRTSSANDNWRRTNLRMQMFDFGQMLALGQNPMLTALQQGPQIAQMYVGQGGVKAALTDTMATFGRFGAVAAAAAAVASLGVIGLRNEIRDTTEEAVSFGDVFFGVLEATATGIYSILQPAIAAVAPWFSALWSGAVEATAAGVNAIVRSVLFAVEDIKYAFMAVPNGIIIGIEGAANGFISAIETMVGAALKGFNQIVAGAEHLISMFGAGKALEFFGVTGEITKLNETVDLGNINIGGAAASARIAMLREQRDRQKLGIAGTDYAGSAYDAIVSESLENYNDRQKPGKSGRTRQSDFDRELESVQDRLEAMRAERDAIGLTETEAARLTVTRKLEAAALKDAIGLSPQRVAAIHKEAAAYGTVVGELERAEKAREAVEFARNTVRGFIDDFRSGLADGKTVWEAFADAAVRAIDKIADRLLDQLLDAVFKVNGAVSGRGGGGGLLGMLFGGGGGLFGGGGFSGFEKAWTAAVPGLWANGGAFDRGNVIPFARGGVVGQPTLFPMANGMGLMGEAGPEAIMPLRRNSAGQLGVIGPAGNNNQPSQIVDNRVFNFTGTSEEFQQFKKFVAEREASFNDRAVGAVKSYHGAGNTI